MKDICLQQKLCFDHPCFKYSKGRIKAQQGKVKTTRKLPNSNQLQSISKNNIFKTLIAKLLFQNFKSFKQEVFLLMRFHFAGT